MSSFKEIVTKAVVGKGKKSFTTDHTLELENEPSTILGCWIINHVITISDKKLSFMTRHY